MKHTTLVLVLAAASPSGCDNKPAPKFEPTDVAPQAPAQTYGDRVRNEIRSVQGSPVELPSAASSPSTGDGYQADLWLSNTEMAAGLAKRLVQDVGITARLYPELAASAENGTLARDLLEPLFSSAVHVPRIREHLTGAMDTSSLRLANEGVKSTLLRRFLLDHAGSFGDQAGFEAFLKRPPELSRWRSDAIASVAYAVSFPTIEQAALSVFPKIFDRAGRVLSAEDLALLDKRAGALSFGRVAYGLRSFSDSEVYQLQQLLAAEPQTRRAFEQTSVALFQSLTGGASQAASAETHAAAASTPVASPTLSASPNQLPLVAPGARN